MDAGNTKQPAPAPTGADAQALIERMKECGWEEVNDMNIVHPDFDANFTTWQEAIDACIQVASGA